MISGTCVVGIDLGGTNMQAVVVDSADAVLGHIHRSTNPQRGVEAVIDDIIAAAWEAVEKAGIERDAIGALGIAAPGAIDMQTGIVLEAPNLGWINVPLRETLCERTGLPVVVENDVNAAAWGAFTLGAGQGCGNGMAVWVGTGVGGGIILGGKLFHGAAHSGAEIGQTLVAPNAHILEHHSGRIGMTRLARKWAMDHPDSVLQPHISEDQQVPTDAIAAALEAGDVLAQRIVADAALHLGTAIAHCVTLLGLEVVVIGGGITETLGDRLLEPTRTAFRSAVFPKSAGDTPLLGTKLASSAGTLGAAMLAREIA